MRQVLYNNQKPKMINIYTELARVLKVDNVGKFLVKTSKGDLFKVHKKDGTSHFTLDSVPVDNDIQKELERLI